MDHISKRKTHEWRNELVRRSGAAPLWIRSELADIPAGAWQEPHDRDINQFFFDLITLNYHRIQKLVVLGYYPRFKLTRSVLNFPVPQLDQCELSFRPSIQSIDQDVPLFANHAPRLRIFILRGCPFNRHAPWLCNLRSVVLDSEYRVIDALEVLSEMHSPRQLIIVGISHINMTTPLPIVSLSRLKHLKCNYFSDRAAVALLLDHIQIPVDCSVEIRNSYYINRIKLAEEKMSLLS